MSLRPATTADAEGLVQILCEPEVVAWWAEHDAAEVAEMIAGGHLFAIEPLSAPGSVAGAIQWHEDAGLIEVRGHHRLTIDPAAANARAIRACARVGFRPVGILRRYERGLDGTWHDGLLMDLLAEELVDEPAQEPTSLRSPS